MKWIDCIHQYRNFMNELKDAGIINFIGLSKAKNFNYEDFVDLSKFDVIQEDINLLSLEPLKNMPTINSYLSLLHGSLVASGLILYSLGAKYLPSGELALLSLMEVVGGVLWVWLPIFGINEIPSFTVILGGLIITSAVIIQGIGSSKKREPVTL